MSFSPNTAGAKSAADSAREERTNMARIFGAGLTDEFTWPHEQTLEEASFLSLVFSRSYSPARESPAGLTLASRARALFAQFAESRFLTLRYRTSATVGRPGQTMPGTLGPSGPSAI